MNNIKEAFHKVKQDMDYLNEEIFYLKESFLEIKNELKQINRTLQSNLVSYNKTIFPTQTEDFPTDPTENPTNKRLFRAIKNQNISISSGNQGVPTDRQTNQQTDRQIGINPQKQETNIDNVLEILRSLDSLKKEVRLKFKRLTEQEFLVFSTIYQLEEEEGFSDYKSISNKLNLTESSIRDYVGRLIKKGIPIEKNKINNKTIHLKISSNLKEIATLPTILQLREI